jgi:lipopolysaccharide transport system ATP-binding protein
MCKENEVLVKVDGVSKKFCRDLKKSLWYGMKDVASELLPYSSNKQQSTKNQEHSTSLRPGEFWANKDISFELRRGECIALMGRNGAGKTTLLKILNGLIKPDAGTIEMRGRVGALIALGAGFNPILTGRENVYVNGSILGLSKEEIDSKMDDIIEFAGIPDFMDSPVQSYSSGMQVRLGFAVATTLEPDILILDEVLAVGDADFRNKCYNRIGRLLDRTAVIFVSHSIEQVNRICNKGLVLQSGRQIFHGDIDEASIHYQSLSDSNETSANEAAFCRIFPPFKSFGIRLISGSQMRHGESLEIAIEVEADQQCMIQPRLQIYSRNGSIAAETGDVPMEKILNGRSSLLLRVPILHLNAGEYFISLLVYSSHYPETLAWSRNEVKFKILGKLHATTTYMIPIELSINSK